MPRVHLTFFNLRQHAGQPHVLPETERARAARFMREEDRQRYLLGRSALRQLCANRLNLPPAEVPLLETERGKPYLADASLHFNLAHSGDCVALAWCETHPVGVDVEILERQRIPSFHDLARNAFSPEECAVLSAVPPAALAHTFFRIWVRKEAIVKAEGCGIAGELQRFSVTRRLGQTEEWLNEVCFPGNPQPWALCDPVAPSTHLAALATHPAATVLLYPTESTPFNLARL